MCNTANTIIPSAAPFVAPDEGFSSMSIPIAIALLSLDRVQRDFGGDLLTLRQCMYSHTHSKSMV